LHNFNFFKTRKFLVTVVIAAIIFEQSGIFWNPACSEYKRIYDPLMVLHMSSHA
jgi:hypothetical protein